MRKLIISTISIFLLMPVAIQADSHEGDDVHVLVTADEAMDMVEKHDDSMPRHKHKKMQMMMKGGMHGEQRKRMYQSGRHHSMNEGAAKCILKNIDRINSNAAAHLLMQACGALNKTE